jgi:hypothetical protein
MTDLDTAIIETCPFCGRERAQWIENDGNGVEGAGIAYCSYECLLRDQARG